MKNWKDKVLGIFAGIGLMSLLMGFQNQSASEFVERFKTAEKKAPTNQTTTIQNECQNGKWQMVVTPSSAKILINTTNGKFYEFRSTASKYSGYLQEYTY